MPTTTNDLVAALVRVRRRCRQSRQRSMPVLLSMVLGASLLALHGPTAAARGGWHGPDRCSNVSGIQRWVPRGYKRRNRACHPQRTAPSTSDGTPPSGTANTDTAAAGTPAAGTLTQTPGGIPRPPAGFVRVLADEFNGTAVDESRWSVYRGGLASSAGCNEADNLLVGNGVLTLLFAYQSSGVCGATWYHGGLMVQREYGGVNQSVTVRFRVLHNDPANTRAHRVIPMRWPSSPSSGGPSPAWYDGEADYCEGSSVGGCTSFLHHSTESEQVSSPVHQFDMGRWHTLRAIQRAGNDVDVFIDDMTTPRWSYNGTPTTVPDVFKRTVLQQECRSSCPTDTTDWERVEIDFLTIDNQQ